MLKSYQLGRANQLQTRHEIYLKEWKAISSKLLEKEIHYRRALTWKSSKPEFSFRLTKQVVATMERLNELRLPWHEPELLFDFLIQDGGNVAATYYKLRQAMLSIEQRKGLSQRTINNRSKKFLTRWKTRLDSRGGLGCHIEYLIDNLRVMDSKPTHRQSMVDRIIRRKIDKSSSHN